MRRVKVGGVVGLGLSALLMGGCPASFSDLCSGAACGLVGNDGGIDADIHDAVAADVAPPGCDLTKDPKDSPACISDDVAIFVSPAGEEVAPGTMARPVKSINAAITLAGSTKPRIYICEGTYAEHVALTSAESLYGGFSCAQGIWTATGAATNVAPNDPGLALKVTGIAEPIVIADLSFTAKSAVNPGDSSIGGFIANSGEVTLRRVSLTAGNGVDGSGPQVVPPAYSPAPGGTPGSSGGSGLGGNNLNCTSRGGNASGGGDAPSGIPADPPDPTPAYTGAGGHSGSQCNGPGDGAPGAFGAGGGSGRNSSGSLTAAGWVRPDGNPGGPGQTAQGGGGGAGPGPFAGGGGAGGCGGAGGPGGQGGGSSFALLVFSTAAKLENCTLAAGNGGNGQGGASGQVGQTGGGGGAGQEDGCSGGAGGHGGSGGGGAGGGGGSSVALGWAGQFKPNIDGTDVQQAATLPNMTLGTAGKAGAAGKGGAAAATNAHAGADGQAGVAGILGAVSPLPGQ